MPRTTGVSADRPRALSPIVSCHTHGASSELVWICRGSHNASRRSSRAGQHRPRIQVPCMACLLSSWFSLPCVAAPTTALLMQHARPPGRLSRQAPQNGHEKGPLACGPLDDSIIAQNIVAFSGLFSYSAYTLLLDDYRDDDQ